MNIIWHSVSPLAGTGYGQQTAIFAPRIKSLGHDVSISAYWGLGGAAIDWNGIRVYPGDEQFGNATLPAFAIHEDADLVITLMDVWVLKSPLLANLPLASWVPVDHSPLPPGVRDYFVETGARPIAMSRFGEQMLAEAGLDPIYVPHGIDTEIFQPRARKASREAMGLGADDFLVGMNAFNRGTAPPRKAFPQVFQAFAKFLKDRPTSKLYMHTEMSSRHEGIDLTNLLEVCGIPESAFRQTRPFKYELGASQEELSALYSMFDVLVAPSYGEGFGIPVIEAQSCGTPVIVSDFSAQPELCGAGWTVEGQREWHNQQRAFWHNPSIDGIYRALHEAYDARHDEALQAQAREFALQYDADRILEEYWVPALEQLDRPMLTEPWLRDNIPASGGLAVDVGANVGNFAAHLAADFDEVHAFEPGPAFTQLNALDRDNVRAYPLAIGAEKGKLFLDIYEDDAQCSAYVGDELDTLPRGKPSKTATVPMDSLDGLGYAGLEVDFLKVDVEGYEREVILGALKTIQASKPRILVEIHKAEHGREIAKVLGDLGYEIEPIPHPHEGVPGGHHWLDARVAEKEFA